MARARQPGIPHGQRHSAADRRGAGTGTVDYWSNRRRHDHRKPRHDADDRAGHSQAEAPAAVQVDDLERQDGTPSERVEEDPGLHHPQAAGEVTPGDRFATRAKHAKPATPVTPIPPVTPATYATYATYATPATYAPPPPLI